MKTPVSATVVLFHLQTGVYSEESGCGRSAAGLLVVPAKVFKHRRCKIPCAGKAFFYYYYYFLKLSLCFSSTVCY